MDRIAQKPGRTAERKEEYSAPPFLSNALQMVHQMSRESQELPELPNFRTELNQRLDSRDTVEHPSASR